MLKALVPLVVCVSCASAAYTGDFDPPSWRGKPLTTSQGWTFASGVALVDQVPDPGVAPLHNPYTLPTDMFYPGSPEGPHIFGVRGLTTNFGNDYMTIGPAFGGETNLVAFAIPNVHWIDTGMRAHIQILYSGGDPGWLIQGYDNSTIQPTNANNAGILSVDEPDPTLPGWRRLSFDLPLFSWSSWQAIALTNSSPVNVDIAAVVIDTIVPAPGAVVVASVGMGLVAGRRRR